MNTCDCQDISIMFSVKPVLCHFLIPRLGRSVRLADVTMVTQ